MQPRDEEGKGYSDRKITSVGSVFILYVLDCMVDFDTSIVSQTTNPAGTVYET